MADREYRAEIDGIRAIAVLSVVLFHLEYEFIPGGFVGVDVFFVISGFLITRILYRDNLAGQFSFKRFYMRRVRRLAPALIVTLLATFAVAAIYLTPDHFQRFSIALVASIFSVSNIFFWAESGYFDASADLKPLLHTWSLSVEEQFYLVWPALIFLFRAGTRRDLLMLLGVLGLASLIAARVFTTYGPSAGFFLMPFRVHEFVMGAALALLPAIGERHGRDIPDLLRELLCLAGLGLILYSVLVFDEYTPFPDFYALVPCLGTALLIACGNARFSGRLVRNPLSTWVGRISYSMYLVHWPLVVLYKHVTFENVVVGKTRSLMLFMTFVLGYLLHRFVENRFRDGHGRTAAAKNGKARGRELAWVLVPVTLIGMSIHAYATDGWSGRFDQSVVNAVGDIQHKQLVVRRQYIDPPDAVSGTPYDGADELGGSILKVLVMGDSHATDMFNALYLNLSINPRVSVRLLEVDDTCLYLFSGANTDQSAALQLRCEEQFERVRVSELVAQADRVVYSTRWERSSFEHLQAFAEFVDDRGAELIVMGRTAEFANVPSLVLKNGLNEGIERQLAENRATQIDSLNEDLKAEADRLNLVYVDKVTYLCNLEENICPVIDDEGHILYTDYGHWSIEGALYFGARLLSDPQLHAAVAAP